MKLTKVHITYFRCFESLVVPLQPDVNVFVGINGAGKTTILDAIAIALYGIVASVTGSGKRRRTEQGVGLSPGDIHIEPRAKDVISGRRNFVQISAQAGHYYPIPEFPEHSSNGEPQSIEWIDHIEYKPPNNFVYPIGEYDIHRYFAGLWREINHSDDRALIPLPVVAYYRADRRLSQMPKMGDVFSLPLGREGAYRNALKAGN